LHCNTAASVFLTIYASMIKNAAPDFFPGHANLFFAACSSQAVLTCTPPAAAWCAPMLGAHQKTTHE
jgi:hypothetical protein